MTASTTPSSVGVRRLSHPTTHPAWFRLSVSPRLSSIKARHLHVPVHDGLILLLGPANTAKHTILMFSDLSQGIRFSRAACTLL